MACTSHTAAAHTFDSLERKWRARTVSAVPVQCVGGAQFFAWDEDLSGTGVVICVGANYSQLPTVAHLPTRTHLGSWMANYRQAAAQVNSGQWNSLWRQHQWLKGLNPFPRPCLFIMTNLVPWITSHRWTSTSLVVTNGMVNGFNNLYRYQHFQDLKAAFPNAFVVGHGVDHRTLPYLQQPISLWSDWMLYANLTFSKRPSRWSSRHNRFMF